MKTIKLFALVGIFSLSLILRPTAVFSEQLNLADHPNYVVIGAFSIHNNAIRFVTHAHNDLNMPARFELNADRKLYYVYVLSTTDRTQAISLARKLRSESEFRDTWVYSGAFGQDELSQAVSAKGVDINPETEQKMERVSSNEQKAGVPDVSVTNETPTQQITPPETPKTESAKTAANTPDNGVEGKNFVFKLFRATDSELVEGDVDAVDGEKSRKMGSFKGNTAVRIPTPPGKTGAVELTCEVFGYRKVHREINYNTPEGEDVTKDENGNVVVPFELVRLQKGDIAVMYNVYFFKDAAIMRPESRYEVNSLNDMLKENPKYKIRIHGHTNGGAAGKIIGKSKDSDNFFSLSDTRDTYGSAKKLSSDRAEIIRDYLLTLGIDPKRMEIKAWGGKKPIYDKHHSRAQENVRVEIEILEDK